MSCSTCRQRLNCVDWRPTFQTCWCKIIPTSLKEAKLLDMTSTSQFSVDYDIFDKDICGRVRVTPAREANSNASRSHHFPVAKDVVLSRLLDVGTGMKLCFGGLFLPGVIENNLKEEQRQVQKSLNSPATSMVFVGKPMDSLRKKHVFSHINRGYHGFS